MEFLISFVLKVFTCTYHAHGTPQHVPVKHRSMCYRSQNAEVHRYVSQVCPPVFQWKWILISMYIMSPHETQNSRTGSKNSIFLGLRNLLTNQFSTNLFFFNKVTPRIILVFSPPFCPPNCLGPWTIQQELKKRLEVYERKLSAWVSRGSTRHPRGEVVDFLLVQKKMWQSGPTPGTKIGRFMQLKGSLVKSFFGL